MIQMEAQILDSNKYSPPPVVSTFKLNSQKTIYTVRDDLLTAGTKQRAVIPYIQSLMHEGFKNFVYASPFSGFAQIALAFACKELGAKCVLFCEKDNDNYVHEFSRVAQQLGADVIPCFNLKEAQLKASIYAMGDASTMRIPLGFNSPLFRGFLETEINRHWKSLSRKYEIKELWLPIGSGTLLNVFKNVVSANVKIYGVNVNVLGDEDERISEIRENSRIQYLQSTQRFHEPAKVLPPMPSNLYYDAKVFGHIKKHAVDGAFWWNVAK